MTPGPGETFEVRFAPHGRSVRVRAGATVMDAALLCGVWIDAPCGGEGTCGKCAVRLEGGVSPPTSEEQEHLTPVLLDEGLRLACQATLAGPCTVGLPAAHEWAEAKAGLAGRAALAVDLPEIQKKSHVAPPLGAALDVGTTTLCVSCIDLGSGERLGIASAENPQTRFGADVMTRIERCRREEKAVARMQHAVIGSLSELIEEVTRGAGLSPLCIVRLVAVGNTTMVHLLLGENPSPLGNYPFEPPVRGPVDIRPSDIGLEAASTARLLMPRVLSGFLGADILAVMLASGLSDSTETVLAVDLGTNGEIAMKKGGRIAACSTAAGPAFEGMNISSGMRAAPGAIESLSRDGRLAPRVLGGGKPEGICGSGLLDAVAALLDAGLLSPSGRLAPADEPDAARGRIRESGTAREFVLAPGSDLTLTQEDIRQFQLAKGAVRSGIEVLSSTLDARPEELERVYLAGVFGSFLKPASAVAVGLLPAGCEGRVEFAGNAALLGAEMMLASGRKWEEALGLAEKVDVLELSGDPLFEEEFIRSLSFPVR